MATANPGTIRYDQLLSTYAVDYMMNSDKYITSKLLPMVSVDKQSDKYAIFGTEGVFDVKNDLRAKGTEAEQIDDLTLSDSSYYCDERALKTKIYDQDVINAAPIIQEEKRRTARLINTLLLGKEYRGARLVFTATNYAKTSKATITAGDQWSADDYATNDPQKLIRDYAYTICNRTGLTYKDLTVVISDYTLNGLRQSPFIQNFMTTTANKVIDEIVLAAYFGVKEVLIGSASYNQSKEGQTASMTGMWGKNALICYTQPNATMEDLSFAKTFMWNGAGNAATQNRGLAGVRKWYDANIKATYIEAELNYDLALTCQSAAYLLSDIVS